MDALLRGTLLHRVLEAWDYRGCVEPVVDRVLRRDAPSLAIREAMASYLRDRATAFAATPVGRRLATGEVASRELPFLLRLGDTLVDGAIDLLLADGTVVDYKTGRDRPESHAQYERQVQIYAMAARTLTGWDAPGAFLCYVDTAEIVEVDISPAALEETSRRALEAVEVLSAYVA